LDYDNVPLVQRERLAKISILGPEYFEESLVHHRKMIDSEVATIASVALDAQELGEESSQMEKPRIREEAARREQEEL
jgi:hypothetical protein